VTTGQWILAVDTATSVVVVAAGTPGGEMIGARTFPAGHRHGSHLLPTIEQLVSELGLDRAALAGIVVGLGPGAFTGLRVGLATAKTMAHGLGVPIVGLSTAEALIAAAPDAEQRGGLPVAIALPAGPHDRVIVEGGSPPRREVGARDGADDGEVVPDDVWLAVDLDGRATAAALDRGRVALEALPATLLRLGAARLADGTPDDAARLVPEYVTLPRGIAVEPAGDVAWSRDRR
jgi:tRNA threonylcarbamoyl adenosine modification protein YeaZ